MKNKDIIKVRDALIKHKNTEQSSRIFCDRVEYLHHKGEHELFGKIFDHHLMFYNKRKLVFKVWLPNDYKIKEFKNVQEALKNVGIGVVK